MAVSLFTIKNMLQPSRYNVTPTDDFRIVNSWTEYKDDGHTSIQERPLKYLCYEFEVINPETGEKKHLYKAVKFLRVIRLPKSAKQSTALMDMHTQIMAALYENEVNFVTIISNVIKPVALGLLFLYGVQGVGENIEVAKEKAHYDFKRLIGALQGTYRVLEIRTIMAEESEWLKEKLYGMQFVTAIRGIPRASRSGEDGGNKGFGGKNVNPNSQGTLEEIITGMADYEYVIEILSTPVPTNTLKSWSLKTEKQMTDWYSQLQGQTSINFNISMPMVYAANQGSSSGWSHNYTNSESVNYSQGQNFGTSVGENVSQSLSNSFSESYGTSASHSLGTSHSTSFGNSINYGNSLGTSQGTSANTGISQGESISNSLGQSTSTSSGTSAGSSYNMSNGTSENVSSGQSMNVSHGTSSNTSTGISNGVSHNVGTSSSTSQSVSNSDSYSNSHSNTQSTSNSFSQSQSVSNSASVSNSYSNSESISAGQSGSSSHGGSQNNGWNTGYNTNNSINSSAGTSSSVGGNISALVGGLNSGSSSNQSTGEGYGLGNNAGNSSSAGTSWTNSDGWSTGTSSGYSESHSGSVSQGITNGQSTSYGNSYGTSEGFSTSHGQSVSQGVSNSVSSSDGTSSSISQSQGSGTSDSMGYGTSYSQGYGASASEGWGTSYGTSDSISVGNSASQGYGASLGLSQSAGSSAGISQGQSFSSGGSSNTSDGTSESYSTGTSQSVSNGTTTGQSYGTSQSSSTGQSYSTGTGTSTGTSLGSTGSTSIGSSSSMGLGPSLGFSKSHQWIDQQVKDILELLEFQNNRLKSTLRGNGAFYTYVYIGCPSRDALASAQSVAKSTWQNVDAMINPLQVLNLSEEEQQHLLYHFSAFSSDITKEDVFGLKQYKYCTVLLPDEITAYTHLPRISEGGVFAEVNDIPHFAVPSMMKGDIYMGKIINAERWTFDHGYDTPIDYRFDDSGLMHGIISGASRSGKTVAAMRFIKELSKVKRKSSGKRLRIICLDPKRDWRSLAMFVEPERFRFYSLGNVNFHPIKLNPWKVPSGVWPQIWIGGIIDIYCRAYGLLERGKQMIGDIVYELYDNAGVFKACDEENWKDIVPELSSAVCFEAIYKKMEEKRDKIAREKKSGFDTMDAYARLLDRLAVFGRKFSIERRLFGTSEGIGIDEMIGNDDVTVLESKGLENTFKNFIFGAITSGFYKYAIAEEKGYLSDDQYETVLVIEEANEVLTGNDCAGTGGGGSMGMSGESEFEQMIDQAAGYGLFIIAITQKISMMPPSLVANAGLKFFGRIGAEEDIKTASVAIGKEIRYEDRDIYKWFPKAPIGWFICQSSRGFDYKLADPVLVKISPLNIPSPSNAEIEEILLQKEINKTLHEFQYVR